MEALKEYTFETGHGDDFDGKREWLDVVKGPSFAPVTAKIVGIEHHGGFGCFTPL